MIKLKEKKYIIILILICVISFLAILLPLEYAHYWDETVYLNHAETISSGKTNYSEISSRPPFLSILIAGTYFIKKHIFSANILVAILGVMGVFFLYLLGKEIYNEKVGLIAAALLAFNLFIIQQAHFIHTDVPSITFITMALYFFMKKKKINQIISGLFFAISILTRFTSMIVLLILIIYILFINKFKIIKSIKENYLLGVGVLIGLLPYFIWAQIKFGFFLSPFILANLGVMHSHEPIYFYIINFLKIFPVFICLGLILWGVNFKTKITEEYLFIFWILLFTLYLSLTPHKEIRYLIPIAAPVFLLSANGFSKALDCCKKYKNAIIFLFLILITIYILPALNFINTPIINYAKSEEMELSEFLIEQNESKDLVLYSNFNYPVFAYYTNIETIRLDNFNNKFYDTYSQTMIKPGMLIIYKYIDSPPSKSWIEDKPNNLKKIKETENIIVYKYEPN